MTTWGVAPSILVMPRKQPGPPCVVCGKPSAARKLCEMHYKRFKRHGHLDQTRPADWGQRNSHPLNGTWRWTSRAGRVPRWNDFWTFVSDVGDRPTISHRLCRQKDDKPFGPKNWYWEEPLDDTLRQRTKAERNAYAKVWRAENQMLSRNSYLGRRYGITLAEYEALLVKQKGRCAICKEKDKWFRLAVDHCHDKKTVRELLCSRCNRGIGSFDDKPELLERAAQYLRRWKSE